MHAKVILMFICDNWYKLYFTDEKSKLFWFQFPLQVTAIFIIIVDYQNYIAIEMTKWNILAFYYESIYIGTIVRSN